ncbi:MAG: glutathione S-transferase [Myxococcota bacterium]
MREPYELYYWPMLPGRGEIVRMILEDAGVAYRDVAREEGIPAVVEARRGALGGTKPFAPPVLKCGDLVLSQTAVIVRVLAERHGLAPDDEVDRLLAQQHVLGWSDLMVECHDTHHPIALRLTYEEQAEAAKERARHFRESRLGPWLTHFEGIVRSGGGVHVGGRICQADLMARLVVRGLAHAFPRAFAALQPEIPGLLALAERVEARPNLAAYLASDRALSFNAHGIFRHYPELDA